MINCRGMAWGEGEAKHPEAFKAARFSALTFFFSAALAAFQKSEQKKIFFLKKTSIHRK